MEKRLSVKSMMLLILYATCILSAVRLSAQSLGKKVKFTSINSIGFLNGEANTPFTMQTINGIQLNNLSMGLGVAIDNYAYRTIPVFVDVRKSFGKHGFKPFCFSDIGISVPLNTDALPKTIEGQPAYSLKNGFYGEWGLGLEKQINTNYAFFISVGYSYKQFPYEYHQNIAWIELEPPIDIKYNFSYNRIALRMGIRL